MICTDGFIAGLPSFIDNLPDLLDPAWSWEVVTSPDAFMLRVKGSCPSRARCCCWLAAAWEEFNCRRVRFIDQTKARAPKLDTPYRLADIRWGRQRFVAIPHSRLNDRGSASGPFLDRSGGPTFAPTCARLKGGIDWSC